MLSSSHQKHKRIFKSLMFKKKLSLNKLQVNLFIENSVYIYLLLFFNKFNYLLSFKK